MFVLRTYRSCQRAGSIYFIRKLHENTNINQKNKVLSPFRRYVLSSYTQYVQNYELALEKRFPSAMQVYRVFKIGIKDFYMDLMTFVKVIRKITSNEQKFKSLSRQELELYFKMPKDMMQVAPVLLISALPFANYVVFPLAYYFPRLLLSSHFWSLQQRVQFAVMDQKVRLKHYKPVFRSLQAQVKNCKTNILYNDWRQCIALLGSGLHPSPQQVLNCIPLFSSPPYSLSSLTSNHLKALLKSHNLHVGWRRRKRLYEHAKMILLMDRAIVREGGVARLTHDEIRSACFLRGLNPTSMNSDETVTWLNQWVNITKVISEDSLSLLLHLPILTAYNHPSNWVLIH